jgi:hypothetical protein
VVAQGVVSLSLDILARYALLPYDPRDGNYLDIKGK